MGPRRIKGSVGLRAFDSGLNAKQCALLEEHGLRFDWRALSDSAYSDLYEKVGDLIVRKGINERGDGENELGGEASRHSRRVL